MITKQEFDILEHTSRTGRYCSDEQLCVSLGERGFLYDHGPQALAGGMHYLVMTSKGRRALVEYKDSLPEPEPLPRRTQRARETYQRFLRCDFGISFGEWLKTSTAIL